MAPSVAGNNKKPAVPGTPLIKVTKANRVEKSLPAAADAESVHHVDPATRANPAKPNLLTEDVKLHHLSPYLGTEVSGVQLSKLSKEGLDELALFVAERKLVIFRDQDLKDVNFEAQIELTKHFGVPHIHPVPMSVPRYPEIFSLYKVSNRPNVASYLSQGRINYLSWHSDVSYEKQPAGTTFFYVLDGPEVGGDTLFLSTVEAYERLSPAFKKLLVGLKAVHTSAPFEKVSSMPGAAKLRRDPVATEHPIIRVHPVTGEKSIYVNATFTSHIVGFKKEESDALLNFLYDHIGKGADFHVRATYRPGTVVVWDNRVTAHTVVADYDKNIRRHHIRLTPQAEKPIPATEV
ncbi:alpha-ketoglutarate-dependent taurine dioxygenase [Ephemerocybe angulata]|uniref:Alpha-ketoglutarate-dependent taurine dioxygenase n=2 Tax=Ephemerocybe angulata TaxID=980116 RepID=A0A8H6HLK8_9AGAR|nr:alpha-ketoglutarate-dependent taurine dioxygenase [Tulosesus angulatus]